MDFSSPKTKIILTFILILLIATFLFFVVLFTREFQKNKALPVETAVEETDLQKQQRQHFEYCGTLADDFEEDCKNDFWMLQAIFQEDKTFCQKYQAKERQIDCEENYVFSADLLKNPSDFDCNRFLSEENRFDCTIFKNNLIECNQYQGKIFSYYCKILQIKPEMEAVPIK